VVYLNSRSPREGSSRGSQFSSLLHSHSGSIEMNEASNISSRGVSFEHELRASSFSSDDGANGATAEGLKGRLLSTETGPPRSSPRAERQVPFHFQNLNSTWRERNDKGAIFVFFSLAGAFSYPNLQVRIRCP